MSQSSLFCLCLISLVILTNGVYSPPTNYYMGKNSFLKAKSSQNILAVSDLDMRFKYLIKSEKLKDNTNSTCSTANCINGKCIESNVCVCKKGFSTTKDQLLLGEKLCDYEMKEHLIGFLLEFFLIFGVGHFYIGNLIIGLIKLISFLLFLVIDLSIKSSKLCSSLKSKNSYYKFSMAIYSIFLLLHVADLAMFGFNKYKDSNGMQLYFYE